MQNNDKRNDQKASRSAAGDLDDATRSPFSGRSRAAVGVLLAVGVVWLLWRPGTSDPAIQPMRAGEHDGYRVVARRATPPAATALSEDFVPAEEGLREDILQRLAEFKATWRVGNPEIYLNSTDVNGDGIAFARQLEGWLKRYGLIRGPAISPDLSASTSNEGDADSAAGGARIKEHPLPAPPVQGFVIRCREADSAMAKNLALALLPVLGGESSILFDERTEQNHLVVSLTGAPSFGESGVAYFSAIGRPAI